MRGFFLSLSKMGNKANWPYDALWMGGHHKDKQA